MSVDFAQIPRNEIGAALPARLRHRDPTFTEGLGVVVFEGGVTTSPLEGPALERVVAAMGQDLVAIEPWADDAGEASETDQAEADQTGQRSHWTPSASGGEGSPPAPQPTVSLPTDRDALLAVAEARGIHVDHRWGAKRIRKAIRGASHADQE